MECGAIIERIIVVKRIVIVMTGETEGKSEEKNEEKIDVKTKERIEEIADVLLRNAEEPIFLFTEEATALAEEMMTVTSMTDGEKPVAVSLNRNR